MIVVSDTSCITNLLVVGSADLLPALFGTVIVPPAVSEELKRSHDVLPGFVQIQPPKDVELVRRLKAELDMGEAEAIVLARETQADRLLIDEKAGRLVAARYGIPVLGLLGLLLLARRRGLIESVTAQIEQLETRTTFYIDHDLRAAVIRDAGEKP